MRICIELPFSCNGSRDKCQEWKWKSIKRPERLHSNVRSYAVSNVLPNKKKGFDKSPKPLSFLAEVHGNRTPLYLSWLVSQSVIPSFYPSERDLSSNELTYIENESKKTEGVHAVQKGVPFEPYKLIRMHTLWLVIPSFPQQ